MELGVVELSSVEKEEIGGHSSGRRGDEDGVYGRGKEDGVTDVPPSFRTHSGKDHSVTDPVTDLWKGVGRGLGGTRRGFRSTVTLVSVLSDLRVRFPVTLFGEGSQFEG